MDTKLLARIGAIAFVTLAVTATAIEFARRKEAPASVSMNVSGPEIDPLRYDQRRCQQLGQKAADDAQCLRIWAGTRDRFLGRTSAPASSSEGR